MRVVIAEDETLLRQGLRLLLEEGGFEVVAAAGDAEELLDAVAAHRPELVITDIRMPPTHTDEGLRAALRIRHEHPEVAIVVLSQYVQRRYALELLGGEASKVGYLLKQRIADVGAFRDDLRRVAAGGTALDPEVVAVLISRAGRGDGVVRRLTRRQREVLAYMAEGRSNAWIGQRLVLTEKAIVQHTSGIYDALGLPVTADDHRRVLAVIRYLDGAAD
ncbi:response regulator transcription factor [Agromyces endophyticus]|uniref:response regulator transcription factor n=1 Tax=Agromyces sp. H17E-10 TaxID=2932244 RepID=UPI001FD0CBF6|nr:response regulator transcription factor [Agromyces sp. H17E-10]UOQ90879.1 response regulator transcription factor [Agromyces sp. H17E-10]